MANKNKQHILKRAITQTNMRIINQYVEQTFSQSIIYFNILGNTGSTYQIKYIFQNVNLFPNLLDNQPNNSSYPNLYTSDLSSSNSFNILNITTPETIAENRVIVNDPKEIQEYLNKQEYLPYHMNCSCPFYQQKNEVCKHISLVFLKIFRLIPDMLMASVKLSPPQQKMLWQLYQGYRVTHNLNIKSSDNLTSRLKAGDDCPVCFDKMNNEDKLYQCQQCKNSIHTSCMLEVVKHNSHCPLCRYEIESNSINQILNTSNGTDIFS